MIVYNLDEEETETEVDDNIPVEFAQNDGSGFCCWGFFSIVICVVLIACLK